MKLFPVIHLQENEIPSSATVEDLKTEPLEFCCVEKYIKEEVSIYFFIDCNQNYQKPTTVAEWIPSWSFTWRFGV